MLQGLEDISANGTKLGPSENAFAHLAQAGSFILYTSLYTSLACSITPLGRGEEKEILGTKL